MKSGTGTGTEQMPPFVEFSLRSLIDPFVFIVFS